MRRVQPPERLEGMMSSFIGFPAWVHTISPLVFGVAVFSTKLMADAIADDIIQWLNRRYPHTSERAPRMIETGEKEWIIQWSPTHLSEWTRSVSFPDFYTYGVARELLGNNTGANGARYRAFNIRTGAITSRWGR